MKNCYTFLLPFLLLCLYGGCGNSNNCAIIEYEENLANSECLAEDFNKTRLTRGCSISLICSGMDTGISRSRIGTCTVIDCKTLECDEISFEGELVFGFMAELENDITNILPTGVFVIDEMEIPFECFYAQQ